MKIIEKPLIVEEHEINLGYRGNEWVSMYWRIGEKEKHFQWTTPE